MYNFKKIAAFAAVLAVTTIAPATVTAQIFKGETAGVGDPVHTMFVTFANQKLDPVENHQIHSNKTIETD